MGFTNYRTKQITSSYLISLREMKGKFNFREIAKKGSLPLLIGSGLAIGIYAGGFAGGLASRAIGGLVGVFASGFISGFAISDILSRKEKKELQKE